MRSLKIVLGAIVLASIALAGCVEDGVVSEMDELVIRLGFDQFPENYTCDGEDISPKITVEGLDDDVVSMALIMEDPDAPAGSFVHWVAWNLDPMEAIPEAIPKVPRISEPIEAVQGNNGFRRIGYNGPCPPPGKPHRYFFRVYGLDADLDLAPGATKPELLEAMEGRVIQRGEAVATYGR